MMTVEVTKEAGERPLSWGEGVLFAVFVGAGLLLRVLFLRTLPPGLDNDEAGEALAALDVLRGEPFRLFSSLRGYSMEMFHAWLLAPILSQTGPAILPLRLCATALSLAGLFFLWRFARSWFGARVGAAAVAFLSLCAWHVIYSRIAFRANLAPVFALAGAAVLAWFLNRPRLVPAILLGLINLCGVLAYTSFRPVALAFLVIFLVSRFPWGGKVKWGSAAFLIPAGIYLSAAVWIQGSLRSVFDRGSYALDVSKISLGRNVFFSLAFFWAKPPLYYRDPAYLWAEAVNNLLSRTLFTPVPVVVSVLLAVGAWECAACWRESRDSRCGGLLLLFLIPVLALGIAGPSFTRLGVALPFACILAAIGFNRLCGAVGRRFANPRIPVFVALSVLLPVTGQLALELPRLARHPSAPALFCEDEIHMADQVLADRFPAGRALAYVNLCIDTVRYLVPPEKGLTLVAEGFEDAVEEKLKEPGEFRVYVHRRARNSEAEITRLRKRFPAAVVDRFPVPTGDAFTRLIIRPAPRISPGRAQPAEK